MELWPAVRKTALGAGLGALAVVTLSACTHAGPEAAADRTSPCVEAAPARATTSETIEARDARWRAWRRAQETTRARCGVTGAGPPRPGEIIWDAPQAPELVVLPLGTFVMGSPLSEPGRDSPTVESPQHEVTISQPIAMSRFEVTLAEYRNFVQATNRPVVDECNADLDGDRRFAQTAVANWRNPGFSQSENMPVVCISWEDAAAYASWLSAETGFGYGLPTEAEWEYGARGGSVGPYPWGQTADHERANYGEEQCCWGLAAGRDEWVYTSPVASLPANSFGLFDMHGNAWEWTSDCWTDSYAPEAIRSRDDDCVKRVIRGGAWDVSPAWMLSATRFWDAPGNSGSCLGFRLVRAIEPSR